MIRFTDAPIALTVISASMALLFGACTTGQPRAARIDNDFVQPDTSGRILYMEPVEPTARTVISKNYTVGSRRVATVDEPMVGVRDYTSSDLIVAAIATRDFVQHCRRPEDLKPQEVAATAAAAEREQQAVDPRAAAEVPSGGFTHEPEAYGASGTSEADRAVSTTATTDAAPKAKRESHVGRFFSRMFGGDDAAASAESTTVREQTPSEEPDFAEPLTPRTAGRADAESDSEAQEQAQAASAVTAVEVADPLACQSGRLSYIHGKRGDRFAVAGAFETGSKRYYLIDVPTPNGNMYIAVDARGRLKYDPYLAWRELDDVVVTRFGIPLEYQQASVVMEEEGRLFRFETSETVSVHGGAYRNFELVYKGTTYDHRGMVYHVLYKEYGRDRPTVPIYIQDLAYASQTQTVDILGMRIRVHDVDDTQISYTIQRD
ncbi:MAG: hypothetical protein V3R77_00735 [Candidatus Binatia bacterium]